MEPAPVNTMEGRKAVGGSDGERETRVAPMSGSRRWNPCFIVVVTLILLVPAIVALFEAIDSRQRNRNNGSLISSGVQREYLLFVPKSYDRARPVPLVISLHGAAGWPVQQMEVSRWNELAEREHFLVVYPAGAGNAGPRIWHIGTDGGLETDVRFIADLLDKLEHDYNIDRARIYANGLSNGGGMSFVLSCTLSDRIAAVGLVASAQTLPWKWCTDPRPVPMIAFHGTADPQVPFRGGPSWVAPKPFPDIGVFVAKWATRNHCERTPTESRISSDVTSREYAHCADDATVLLYTIEDGGHTWPGGGPLPEWGLGRTTQSIDASAVMWKFFRAHPLSKK